MNKSSVMDTRLWTWRPRFESARGYMAKEIIITTANEIPGKRIVKTLGIVTGSTIRAKHIGKDIIAALRNIVGGEIKEYTEMLSEARKEALQRMENNARKIGADAVIGVRLTTSMISTNAAEILVYGTAVKFKR